MKILLVNEFNINKNNSAGITVRRLLSNSNYDISKQIVISASEISFLIYEETILQVKNDLRGIKDLIDCVKNYNFDLVYSTGTSIKSLAFLLILSKCCRKKVLLHYFDNWREIGHSLTKNVLIKWISGKKETALVIGDEMGAYYHKRYGGKYYSLMMGAEYSPVIRLNQRENEGFIFLYTGGLHLGRVDYLIAFEKVISGLDNVHLLIATFKTDYEKYCSMFQGKDTRFLVDVPHERLKELYEESDALLFVEPGPVKEETFLKYSLSTKIPEYLSSGLPILCFSKKGIAATNYFKRTESALVVTVEEQLLAAIKRIGDGDVADILKNAHKYCVNDFSYDAQQFTLKKAITTLLRGERNE